MKYRKNDSDDKSSSSETTTNTNQNTTQSNSGGPNYSASHGAIQNIHVHASTEKEVGKSEEEGDLKSDFSEIRLAPIYTSLFAEENKLKTERICIIKQEHGYITGHVELREIDSFGKEQLALTYTLEGRFSNKVLTAEYYSSDDARDERGAINLKLIDLNILSGFCSFSKLSSASDDEIRVSPYIWIAGDNVDLLNGTYGFCTDCYKQKEVCCCASEKIDMPLFLSSEVSAIRSELPKKKNSIKFFSKVLDKPFDQCCVRQIDRIEKNNSEGQIESRCFFFDLDVKQCKIYDSRPIDCRLFPFDIRLSKSKSEYLIGYYPDLCDRALPEFSEMKKYAHILRPYFFLLYPYLHIITSNAACERLKDADFTEIGTFKDFVF